MRDGRDKTGMTRFDAHIWQLSQSPDGFGSLSQLVARAPAADRRDPVTIETLIADDVAPLAALGDQFPHTEHRAVGAVSLLHVWHPDGPFVLSAWPSGYNGVFHVIGSIPSTDKRWRKVERSIGKASPGLAPCFLNHDDFLAIGTALSEHGNVEVSRLTARRPMDLSSLQRGWQQQARTLRPDPLEAIARAEDEDASVRTLTLHVSENEKPVLTLHLRRIAGATFYSGNFGIFDDVVLSRLAAAAARRAQLLTGRARTLGQPLPKPISIRLPKPVLIDAEATGQVLSVLERGSALSVAVMHRNPYLHVLVTDNHDGSNFDVVVTEEDTINVFPGFRASMGSFNRLTQRLGEHFEALAISEAAPAERVSLDDLVLNV